jgi:hypothetical protein
MGDVERVLGAAAVSSCKVYKARSATGKIVAVKATIYV